MAVAQGLVEVAAEKRAIQRGDKRNNADSTSGPKP